MRFREFLINEAKMITVDADDADAVNQIKKAKQMDGDRVAAKRAIDAQKDRRAAAISADPNDPAARLKKQRADQAAKLAMTDKQISQKQQVAGSSNSAE